MGRKMDAVRVCVVSSVVVLALVICPSNGQLADNLMVSGSDRPMAYGVGTYGLKGAGTQGVSGQSQAGGLYSQKIPTFTMSRSVPGVIVSDGEAKCISLQDILCRCHKRITVVRPYGLLGETMIQDVAPSGL